MQPPRPPAGFQPYTRALAKMMRKGSSTQIPLVHLLGSVVVMGP
ncbi:hypothetical protein [Brevibacillus formosus]|nr:hypothetical protein [Brevibacillus formosus]